MPIELPAALKYLEPIVGMEWPEGNEDQMWALGGDWRTAASELRSVIPDIEAAKSASMTAYPSGDGYEEMVKAFDSLLTFSGSNPKDDQTLSELADYFKEIGDGAYDVGTEIEYGKLMYWSSLALLAAELAASFFSGPFKPAVDAAAIALTRLAVRIIGQRLVQAVIQRVGRIVANRFVNFLLRHVAIDTILGTMQELGVQAYQVEQGHRQNINIEQVIVTAVSSAAGGAAAGPLADRVGKALTRKFGPEFNPYLHGAITGTTAGLAGAGAGFVAATATQFGFDVATDGLDQALKNLGNTPVDWRMFTAGASNGAMTSVTKVGSAQMWNKLMPTTMSRPDLGTRLDNLFADVGPRVGFRPEGTGTPGAGDGSGLAPGVGTQNPASGANNTGASNGAGAPRAGVPAAGNGGNTSTSPANADTSRSGESTANDADQTSSADSTAARQDGEPSGRDGESATAAQTSGERASSGEQASADEQSSGERSASDERSTSGEQSSAGERSTSDTGAGLADEGKQDRGAGADRTEEPNIAAGRQDSAVSADPSGTQRGTADGVQTPGTRSLSDAPLPGATPVAGTPMTGPAATPPTGPATASAPPSTGVAPGAAPASPASPATGDARPAPSADPRGQAATADSDAGRRAPASRAGVADRGSRLVGDEPAVRAGRTDSEAPRAESSRETGETRQIGATRQDTGTRQEGETRQDGEIRQDGQTRQAGADRPEGETSRSRPAPDSEDGRRDSAEPLVLPLAGDTGESRPARRPGPDTDDPARRDSDDTSRDEPESDTPPRDPTDRGECARLSLEEIQQATGSDTIRPPDGPVGERGMSLRDIQRAAGGHLWDYPDGGPDQPRHQAIADELLRMAADMDPRDVAEGRGPRALVVDEYTGPVDEHGVGAHAYTMTVRMNPDTGEFRIEVSDPGAGSRRGFPPDLPTDVRSVSAILFDGQGKAVQPSGTDPRVRRTDDRPIYNPDGEIAGRRDDETPKQFQARMRAEMADMRARGEAERARRLRNLLDRIDDADLPEGVSRRSLRIRAAQAEWHAREFRKNADTWWKVAGGRPADDAPIPPRSPADPALDPARSRDDANSADPTRIPPGDRDRDVDDEAGRSFDPAIQRRDVDDEARPEPGDRKVAPLDRDGARDDDAAQPSRDRTLDESPDFLGESHDVEDRLERGGQDDVPAGMYRDDDGLLHKFGDRPDSYRDPDGTWHHKEDGPGTYRNDSFRLRNAVNNEYLTDHLTKRPYRFLADLGPESPYTVVDERIARQIEKAVSERETLQKQRNEANKMVKRHMAEFGIKKITDLAEEKLATRVQSLLIKISESGLPEPEKLAKMDRLFEMERHAVEFNRLGPLLVNASKALGELGGRAFALDPNKRPGAVLLSPFEGAIDGADTVDIAVLVPGGDGRPPKLVVVEAKGVGSRLQGSKVAEAQQGSPEYLRRTAAIDKNLRRILTETPEEMAARGVDPEDPVGRALLRAREELLRAHFDGTLEIEYHLVHVSKDGDVKAGEFNLKRDGVLVRVEVIGGITSPALVRTSDQAPTADDPARETDDSPVPPQDDGAAAAARDLLGVPGEDEWSSLNPEQVGERLREHLSDAMGEPDFEVFGFDLPGLDPEVVREYARAMIDLFERFPTVDLRSIGIGGLPPEVIGMAQPRLDASGHMFTESIVLSYDHATSAQTFRDRMQVGVDNGRFSTEVLRRPVRAVVAHEYGHALDYASQQSARHRAEEFLYERYVDDETRAPELGFEDWLHQLSGHSFDREGNLRPEEALSEAFAEYVLRSDDDDPELLSPEPVSPEPLSPEPVSPEPLSPPARALHDVLTQLAAEPADVGDAPLSLQPDHVDLPGDGPESDAGGGANKSSNGPPQDSPPPEDPGGGPEPGDRKVAPLGRDDAAEPPRTGAADGGSGKPPADPPARTPDEPDDGANNRDEQQADEPYQVRVWPPPEQNGDGADRSDGADPAPEEGARRPVDVAAATEWANREYDRMLAERHRLTREMEFWQAKRDDRITRLMDVADPETALGTREALADTMRRLDEAATRRTVDIAALGEEAGRQVSEQRSAADRMRRLRDMNKLEEAARHVIQLRERIAVLDSRLRELVRDGAVENRPLLADALIEQHRLAGERARELLRIKPRRGMRDDLARRLGLVDEQGTLDEAALEPDRLAETMQRLASEHPARSDEIDMLDEVAREVNEAHNRIGRIQDRMAEVAGAGRRDVEAAGGRMATDWVGVVDGEPPRIIVYGPREPLTSPAERNGMSEHDLALQHALHTSEAVVRAMLRPDVTVEYRRVVSDRTGDWTIDRELSGPQLRHLGGRFGARNQATPPRGLDVMMWRAANGEWQQVDPSRPDWAQNRRDVAADDFNDRDLPEGVSAWAVDQIQATVHDWFADPPPPEPTLRHPSSPPPPEPVNQDLLPHIVGGATPANPNIPTYELPFADAFSQLMRFVIETARLSGFTWFADRDNPDRIRPGIKGHPWFRAPQHEHQPLVRPVEPDDVTDDRGTPEHLRERARQRREDWARVQRWADEQYERFLADTDDVERISERVRQQHRREREAATREVLDVLRRRVLPHAAINPRGDLDAQLTELDGAMMRRMPRWTDSSPSRSTRSSGGGYSVPSSI
ncbi:hypothetical protein ACRS6B_02990 [Nocardia asteroides]